MIGGYGDWKKSVGGDNKVFFFFFLLTGDITKMLVGYLVH